jgi:hypothetical protein
MQIIKNTKKPKVKEKGKESKSEFVDDGLPPIQRFCLTSLARHHACIACHPGSKSPQTIATSFMLILLPCFRIEVRIAKQNSKRGKEDIEELLEGLAK